MPSVGVTKEVESSIGKVNDELAVGEDLQFQRRWWRFEKAVWLVFTAIIALDLAGAFGRGPLANGKRDAADGSIHLNYERIERVETPSTMTVKFGPKAILNGQVKLYASESIVKKLGAGRIIPAPQSAEIGRGGLTYTFPASTTPAEISIEMQPRNPGLFRFRFQVPGGQPVDANVVVMP